MADEAVEVTSRGRKIRPIRIEGDVAHVTLTRGFEAILDAADVSLVSGRNWYALVNKTGHAYAVRQYAEGGKQKCELMHRTIMGTEVGREVDHIDGDGLNNRRRNLRNCSHNENMANAVVSRRNRLGLKGAYKKKNRYRACIRRGSTRVNLGSYLTPEEAAAAYRGAALVLYGAFANGEDI